MSWMATSGPRATLDLPLLPARVDVEHFRERFHDPADDVAPTRLAGHAAVPRPRRRRYAALMAQGGPSITALRSGSRRRCARSTRPPPWARSSTRSTRAAAAGRDLRAAPPGGRPRAARRAGARALPRDAARRLRADLRGAPRAARRPRPALAAGGPTMSTSPDEHDDVARPGRRTRGVRRARPRRPRARGHHLRLAVRGRRGRAGVRRAARPRRAAQAAVHQRPHPPAGLARADRERAGHPVPAQRPLPGAPGRPGPGGGVEAPGRLRDRPEVPHPALRRRVEPRGDRSSWSTCATGSGPPPRPARTGSTSTARTWSTTSPASAPPTPRTCPATRSGPATR